MLKRLNQTHNLFLKAYFTAKCECDILIPLFLLLKNNLGNCNIYTMKMLPPDFVARTEIPILNVFFSFPFRTLLPPPPFLEPPFLFPRSLYMFKK